MAVLFLCGASGAAESGDSLFNRAIASYQGNNMADAADLFGLAGQAYAKEKNALRAAQCYYNKGLCQMAGAQGTAALDAFGQAEVFYRQAKDAAGECNALFSAAQLFMDAMRWDEARERYERGLKIAQTPLLKGLAQEGLGRVHREKGSLGEAEKFFAAAEKSYRDNPGGRLRVRLQLAYLTGLRGNVIEAGKLFDSVGKEAAAMQKNEKTRAEGGKLAFYALSDKGALMLRTGWFSEAQKILADALAAGEKWFGPDEAAVLGARNNYALTFMYLGDFGRAEKELSELLGVAVGTGNSLLTMELYSELGVLARMRGQYDAALTSFQNFRAMAEGAGHGQRLAQAHIQLGNLYAQVGAWNEAAASYQEALPAALAAQDMDSALIAMQGIYAGDIRNELGLAGKVDYKSMQGLPWRAALTARKLTKSGRRNFDDAGFFAALSTVDSLRREIFAPIPSLDGFRLIREMAFRGAPEVRHYYQEAKAAFDIGDAALRRAERSLRAARNAENALSELSARAGEAAEPRYVEEAFAVTLNLLRALAGEEMLSPPKKGFFVQIGGIFLEAEGPEDDEKASALGAGGVEADLKTLSRMIPILSLKAAESDALQKSLIAGEPFPAPIKDRLRRALFSKAFKEAGRTEEAVLKKALVRILETTNPSLKKEAGSVAAKGGKLYDYALQKIKAQQARVEKDAEEILPHASPYLLLSLSAGEDVLEYLNAWQNMRRRAIILRELGVPLKPDKSWEAFLTQLGGAVGKGRSAFEAAFAFTPEKTDAGAVKKLRALAEKLALLEAKEEGDVIAALLALEGRVSHDDRLALTDLQSRIFYALSEPKKAEEAARRLLALAAAPTAGTPKPIAQTSEARALEAQPGAQWRVYGLLARLAEDRQDYVTADRLYTMALAQAEKIHPLEGTTSQNTADRIALYDGAVRAAFALWKKEPSAESAERLWGALEGMKGRQWKEMLATTGGEFLNALPPEARSQVRELEMTRVALEGAYRQASYEGKRDVMAQVNEEMKNLRAKRAELTRKLTVDVSEIPRTESVRALLPADWGLADYYISPSVSFAVLLKKDGEPKVVPLDVDYDSLFGYAYWMRSVKDEYAEYDEKKFPGRGRPRVTACGLSPEDVGGALFQPVADRCGDLRKLLIVPHDILYVLPFEAMQRGEGDEVSYLVSEWTFAELPSAFLLTHGTRRERAAEGDSLLLVANPAYAKLFSQSGRESWKQFARAWRNVLKRDPEMRALLETRVKNADLNRLVSDEASPEEQAEFRATLQAVWEEILSETGKTAKWASLVKKDFARSMAPLPGSQTEADIIQALWEEKGRGASAGLLSAQASEQDFWDNEPGRHRYVHIACHGYDRGSIPDLQPGLALSPVLDFRNDSFLQMGELSTVRWNAELVTLSACETGLGDLYVGDGMFGLSTVLLTGGAKGSVLTRWRAADDSAPIFMEKMYAEILDGTPPAEAMRAAQLYLLETGSFKEPRHWALFKYVGVPW